ADLGAAVFAVQHLAPSSPALLPRILQDVGPLPAVHPQDGAEFRNGNIYIAPPDHHLLVERGRVRVVRGPEENRFRPAIDPLFRSAARAYGPRVLGVLLTGNLDDGTVGLQAIKRRGGTAIVQDPNEAEYPSMPKSALKHVKIDHCLPVREIGPLLTRLTREPAAEEEAYDVPKEMEFESQIAGQRLNTQEFLDSVEKIGARTTYTCPVCSGSIWRIGAEEPMRFRCHTGHSFTAGPFFAEQTAYLEQTLWSAVKTLEEKVTFARQLAARMRERGENDAAKKYDAYAAQVDREVGQVRDLILNGFATRRNISDDDPQAI
ncbi:MAG TPA: chemotaxis protein CheB, partial [Candidatus Binatia bacterium]